MSLLRQRAIVRSAVLELERLEAGRGPRLVLERDQLRLRAPAEGVLVPGAGRRCRDQPANDESATATATMTARRRGARSGDGVRRIAVGWSMRMRVLATPPVGHRGSFHRARWPQAFLRRNGPSGARPGYRCDGPPGCGGRGGVSGTLRDAPWVGARHERLSTRGAWWP